VAITTWAVTSGSWDNPKFDRGWDGPALIPAKGDLTLSSSAPIGKLEFFISPAKADLEIIQSYEWDELTTSWVTTPGTWTTGPVPQVSVGTGVSPDKADLTFTAYSPKVGLMYDFRISAPTLTLTGILPAGGEGFTISPDSVTLEILQSYNWNNYGGTWAASSDNWDVVPFVPSAVETGQNQPDAASLTLTGIAPTKSIQELWYVPSASLALTGFIPTYYTGHLFTPDSANLTGFGTTSWADTSGNWASSSSTWGTGTLSPTAGVTYTFTIDSSGNLVFTPYDPEYPIERQPKFISPILIS